ncbi:MAG: hypothetical protein LBF78_00600 [Treponema sp.]|jgi:DNA-directed RNA polymerase subunit H (RpoH/RPB5)|nr:hypothetical protein [Treponema sp.]
MTKILSQYEIDQLLAAIDAGVSDDKSPVMEREGVLNHNIIYSLDELKELIVSKADAAIIHIIKRYMHKITTNKRLPGEIFRRYPKNINFAYIEFRSFLESNKFREYNIGVSNYGRIKINDIIEKQIEEKEGWFYIKTKDIHYPVWRFVAEVWCEFPYNDACGWQVHHISNDGNNNTPENLIWIKDTSHNLVPKHVTDKMPDFNFKTENNEEINRIINIINTSNFA